MHTQPTDPTSTSLEDLSGVEPTAAEASAVKGGLVVLAIIAVPMALLLPAVQKTAPTTK
jgi:hypothetical protein